MAADELTGRVDDVALPEVHARLDEVQRRLGVRFADPRLLLQALIHRSAVLERERDGRPPLPIASNERLEFLGDAVVNLLAAEFAYLRYPELHEGHLTEVRSSLARRSTMGLLAQELGLGELVYMGRSEARASGRGHLTVLAEALEALVAALYLDQGLQAARSFLEGQFAARVDELVASGAALNAKSRLQELAQARLGVIPRYTLLSRSGPAHDSRFLVAVEAADHTGQGEGTSKQGAEQHAAELLLDRLGALLGTTDAGAGREEAP